MEGIESRRQSRIAERQERRSERRSERQERRDERRAERERRRQGSSGVAPTPTPVTPPATGGTTTTPGVTFTGSSQTTRSTDTASSTSSRRSRGLSAEVVSTILDTPKSLVITAQEIVSKLNEKLKIQLPNGIESLKPEDVTPEATANNIVAGVTALFDSYRKSNPDISDEEALKRFVASAKKGVEEGYSEAYDTLKALGAFKFNGVEDDVKETLRLITEKLDGFEKQKRVDLGLDTPEAVVEKSAAGATSLSLTISAGKSLSVTA